MEHRLVTILPCLGDPGPEYSISGFICVSSVAKIGKAIPARALKTAAAWLVLRPAVRHPDRGFWANVRFQKVTVMPAAVRIKAGQYGSAIGLLLEPGGAFQTRHERTLIVHAAQKNALEQAGLIETIGLPPISNKVHVPEKDAG
jgi:hypothetical protein